MDWVKLATDYFLDPCVADLDDAAEVMFIRGLSYAGGAETHGKVPRSILLTLGRKRHAASAKQLVAAGLWTEVEGGWQIARWDDWQSELEALVKRRSNDRDRQARHRAASRERSRGPSRDSHAPESKKGEEEVAAAAATRPLPPPVEILKTRLDAAKMVVRWDTLTDADVADVEQLLVLHGDGPLMASALRQYRPDNPAAFARAWLAGWRALPPPGRLAAVTASCPEHHLSEPCRSCAADLLVAEVGVG